MESQETHIYTIEDKDRLETRLHALSRKLSTLAEIIKDSKHTPNQIISLLDHELSEIENITQDEFQEEEEE